MTSILNSRGLKEIQLSRRMRYQEQLRRMTSPVTFKGEFVGIGFRDASGIRSFCNFIPEESRRTAVFNLINKNIRVYGAGGAYILAASMIDTVLDIASGVK